MKLAIISDCHLGFGQGSERDRDAFDQARQALEISLQQGVDAVLIPGDLFDSALPRQETFHDAFDLLTPCLKASQSSLVVVYEKERENLVKKYAFLGVPVIALHGNHEYRSKGYKNPIEVLQSAGFLLHVHAGRAVLKKGGETVNVYGMSSVPEKYALEALKAWNPKPESGKRNVLLLHQGFKEFLPDGDDMIATISLENLPKGFDWIVNGHLHWVAQHELGTTTFLLCGSTLCTSLKAIESGDDARPKGFHLYDSVSNEMTFVPIPVQRSIFYHKPSFEKARPEEVVSAVRKFVEEAVVQNKYDRPALCRVKCKGTLAQGFRSADIDLFPFEKEFEGKLILSLDKDFDDNSLQKTIQELRALQLQKKSVAEMGVTLLEQNLQETDWKGKDVHAMLELLENGELEKALDLLKQ